MPGAKVLVLGHFAIGTVVVKYLEATVHLAPLGEAAFRLEDLGHGLDPLLQILALNPRRVLEREALGQLAEQEGLLLSWGEPLDLAAVQKSHLVDDHIRQTVVALGEGFFALVGQCIEEVGPTGGASYLAGGDQVISLQGSPMRS